MADNPNPNPVKDIKYGELNDITRPVLRKRLSPDSQDTFASMAIVAKESYKTNAIQNVGSFKGIVLRVVVSSETQNTQNEKGGWFQSFYEDKTEEVQMLIELKVRVPEVHSTLPMPTQLGNEVDEDNRQIIEMYPTFVAQSTAVENVEPGELVWVDWGNRQNWTDPYYIRPVKEEGPAGAGKGGGPGAKGAHTGPCTNSYTPTSPTGDSTSGKNAKLPAHVGLPRLKRKQKPKGKPVLIKGPVLKKVPQKFPVLPGTVAQWQKIVDKKLPPGRSWIGACKTQGLDDSRFGKDAKGKPIGKASRANIIWYSNSTDFGQQWELMYFFHGLNEFTQKTFEEQIAPQISTAVAQGRNFVLVMPELPWSKNFGGKRQHSAFNPSVVGNILDGGSQNKRFRKYHAEIMKRLNELHGKKKLTPNLVSIYAHSAGGGALKYAAKSGCLKSVGVERLFLSDCDYMGVTKSVWDEYVKTNKNVWMTCMTRKGKPRKATDKAFKIIGAVQKEREIYHIKTKKSHAWCGANCIITISDELVERYKKKKAAEIKKAEKEKKPGDNEAETEENKTDAPGTPKDEKKGIESLPKKDPSGKAPPAQTPPSAPSEMAKKSAVDPNKKYSFTSKPAPKWKSNRVRTYHYGGSLVGEDADRLLVKVQGNKKLHVLVAARYHAMKAAAKKDGFNLRLASAWRRHKWKSWEHYEKKMIAGWGSVRAGRRIIAYNSPHETGMALDLGCHGIKPTSKTIPYQKTTKLYKWMKNNAHKFGFSPYKVEPWHWECRLPYQAFITGKEFTQDYSVRVTNIGGPFAHLPKPGKGQRGPQRGQSGLAHNHSGGGGARCVATNGGTGKGGGPPGPYTPGKVFQVSGGGKVSKKLKPGPPPHNAEHWGNPKRVMKDLKLYVLHETAGWPNRYSGTYGYLKGMRDKIKVNKKTGKQTHIKAANKVVTYWGTIEGDIIQLCEPVQITPHANSSNRYSVGIEVSGFANSHHDYACKWERRLAMGMHQVSHKGKGDIQCEPGKHVASAPGMGTQLLSTLAQMETAWQLGVFLAKQYKPPAGTKKSLKIQFPCVPATDGKFWWSKWNGEPVGSGAHASCNAWFKKHEPVGFCSHARIDKHHDGLPVEYYCYARAKGMSPKNAFYAMVGAVCSGNKVFQKGSGWVCWTPLPNKEMVAIGKKKYKPAWFTQKTSKLVGKKKWKKLAPNHPEWFADAKYHKLAGTKGYS